MCSCKLFNQRVVAGCGSGGVEHKRTTQEARWHETIASCRSIEGRRITMTLIERGAWPVPESAGSQKAGQPLEGYLYVIYTCIQSFCSLTLLTRSVGGSLERTLSLAL